MKKNKRNAGVLREKRKKSQEVIKAEEYLCVNKGLEVEAGRSRSSESG